MRLIKKAVCVLLIVALAVSVVPTTASASALSVVGTSFSSAGMTSAEFAASAGPFAIGILAALAAAYGIKTYTQSDTGQAVKDNFMDLIRERAAETRRSEAEEMEILLGNATIGEQGNIVLGRLSYAEAKEILLREDIPVTVPEPSVSLNNFNFVNSTGFIFSGDYIFYIDDVSNPANRMFYQDGQKKCWVIPWNQGISTGYFKRYTISSGYELKTVIASSYGQRFYVGGQEFRIFSWDISGENANVPNYSTNEILAGSYTQDDLVANYPPDTLYGVDETLREQNIGLHEGLVLAPDLINSAVLGGASGQISASDYCGALVDYVSGYDTVIDGVTVTGLPEAGTVPRTIDEAPAADTVIDEAPPSTMTGTEAAGLYSFSLDELFPFCLPFDFVKIIEKFNVDPEAPNFDWRFYIPGVIDYTLHIDLSAWNTAAEVCRTMVLIAFMVGLIMLTRQIFIRA